MKILNITTTILIGISFLSACSKKEVKPAVTLYPQQNFWNDFIIKSGFNNITIDSFAMGHLIKFRALTNGKINSFVTRQPKAGFMQIWLKDSTLNSNLFDSTLNTVASNIDYLLTINPINLKKNAVYYLIFKSQTSFKYTGQTSASPIIVDNIEIIGNDFGARADGGSGLSYFNNLFKPSISNTMFGNVSFNFQKTD